ncbi:MAG: response regulator [Desulfobacteraceae bacterium]|nr:response regulator [Desulfobacteraceae bacterium]MBC2756442.1 response regulator [Desulfobacteraceae bacterium]MBC2763572.1 response regulator [ANME-2 cluster archaeon]
MKSGTKVLVVDDEKRICHNVKKILSKNNFEVTEALNAADALDKMAKESFSLLISDIVMPDMNGLELLKLVKNEWPLTKAVMMTAYASTETAVKAIRLGALDYIPKPFTPDELRTTIDRALSDELVECKTPPEEKDSINIIDVDIPFDQDEVAKYTGKEYAKTIGPSDIPVIEVKMPEPLENFCEMGKMVCDIFKKLGTTCKVGVKKSVCPQKKSKKGQKAKKGKTAKGPDVKTLIGIDMPFSYKEIVSVTGPEYVDTLQSEGAVFIPYETLKQNVNEMLARDNKNIDVDIPFDQDEVAKYTGDAYAKTIGPSDMPVIEVKVPEPLENFCEMGNMVCDIFKKLGTTCKVGVKKSLCPQKSNGKKAKKGKTAKGPDVRTLIGIDMPFDYTEVAAVTSPEYVRNLHHSEVIIRPYEELKKEFTRQTKQKSEQSKVSYELMKEPVHKNILVIDDEVSVNNNIRKILNKKGYHVDQAVTKSEALEKIHSASYHLILLDLRIPEVKGLELLKSIHDHRPEAKVIIITGYASIETAVETARMGAVDYLNKPFTPNEIRHATENALRFAA